MPDNYAHITSAEDTIMNPKCIKWAFQHSSRWGRRWGGYSEEAVTGQQSTWFIFSSSVTNMAAGTSNIQLFAFVNLTTYRGDWQALIYYHYWSCNDLRKDLTGTHRKSIWPSLPTHAQPSLALVPKPVFNWLWKNPHWQWLHNLRSQGCIDKKSNRLWMWMTCTGHLSNQQLNQVAVLQEESTHKVNAVTRFYILEVLYIQWVQVLEHLNWKPPNNTNNNNSSLAGCYTQEKYFKPHKSRNQDCKCYSASDTKCKFQ